MRLAGTVAVITGGAAGIGLAYGRRFLAEGARVVLGDVAGPVAGAVELAPGRAYGVRTDVSDMASVRAMVHAAVARFGRIDVLVNNAAVFATLKPQPFDEIPEAEWDRVMAVNVKGTALLLHYVTSKGAVVAMTRALARELGPSGITVNAVAPGLTLSDTVQTNPDITAFSRPPSCRPARSSATRFPTTSRARW